MPRLTEPQLRDLVATARASAEIPGLSVAVWQEGTSVVAADGVASVRTAQPVIPETLFQIGSVSKPFTAAAVLRLVEAGRWDLDDLVSAWVPELAHVEGLRIRHLLTHTGGLDGDFTTTSWDDDALVEFVRALAQRPIHDLPGAAYSYSNAGFNVLGRLLEVETTTTYDEALADLIGRPLHLLLETLPWEAMTRPVAVGHLETPDGLEVARPWADSRSAGPCGGVICTAQDLLAFGQALLLRGGGLLSEDTRAQMQQRWVEVPDGFLDDSAQGLGVQVLGRGDQTVVGHSGSTLGQGAALRALPSAGLVMALLGNADAFAVEAVADAVWAELTGVVPRPRASTAEATAPPAGTYSLPEVTAVVEGSCLDVTLSGWAARRIGPRLVADLEPAGPPSSFHAVVTPRMRIPVAFTGSGSHLHLAGRALRRQQ